MTLPFTALVFLPPQQKIQFHVLLFKIITGDSLIHLFQDELKLLYENKHKYIAISMYVDLSVESIYPELL